MVPTVWERYITVSHQLTSGEYSRFPPIEEQLCHLGGVPQALQHAVHVAGVPQVIDAHDPILGPPD